RTVPGGHADRAATSRVARDRRSRRLLSGCEVGGEPVDHRGGEANAVFAGDYLVSLVVEEQELGGAPAAAYRVDDLLRLTDRHVRVVDAVHDEQRRGEIPDPVDG